jgi:glycerol-3-phosphate O-acyltransferase
MEVPQAFADNVRKCVDKGIFSEKYYEIIIGAYRNYHQALISGGQNVSAVPKVFDTLLQMIKQQCLHPIPFESFHKRCSHPYDHYNFGLDFMRPLVDMEKSELHGLDNVAKIKEQVSQGENVVLLSNHQTEADPQMMAILLEKKYPEFVREMIFVAGARVLLDIMAAPFSLGLNLLCIHSKKRTEQQSLKEKARNLFHNKRTMKEMGKMLREGGQCIYVAPSGGRDRPDGTGKVVVSEFDQRSIDIFELIAKKAKTPTHFYTLTMKTYDIIPPPNALDKEVGEQRNMAYSAIKVAFGEEVEMHVPEETREQRAKRLSKIVRDSYDSFLQ